MIITVEKNSIVKKCSQEDCNNIAIATIGYKNIFKHNFCLCKNCLNIFYKNIGKFITPKSPKNVFVSKLKEEKYE